MKARRLHSKEVRAVLGPSEYEALLRLSDSHSRNFAQTIRDLITGASARSWESAAAPRLAVLEEQTQTLGEEVTHLRKRIEDLIAIVRSIEQVLLGRLDEEAALLTPILQLTTLTALRMQAVIEFHPNPEVQKRFQVLLRQAEA